MSAAETNIDEMERKRDEMVWELVQMADRRARGERGNKIASRGASSVSAPK